MELISNLIEQRLKDIKILKEDKEPRLFELKSAFIREKICPTCGRKLKITRKGAGYCNRVSTKCKVFVSAKRLNV